MSAHDGFALPPVPCRDDGDERRVGFELEFTGLGLEPLAEVAREALGGRLSEESQAKWRLDVDELGEFVIELDWAYLKRRAEESGQTGDDDEWLLGALKSAAEWLVPLEVVCPPIPLSRLSRLHRLTDALREAGAAGTDDSLLAAFGVHVNIEAPSMDAATLVRYTRAFALLQWWLVEAHEVDLSRRITPYIDPWPQDYVTEVLAIGEDDGDAFFDGYLRHNPSRNRGLDLLPLLAEIDAGRVRAVVDDARVKARPAFHYRLPNCHVDRADWSLATPWASWLVVERLAADGDALEALGQSWSGQLRPLIGASRRAWVDHLDTWLRDRGLV